MMSRIAAFLVLVVAFLSVTAAPGPIRISSNGRYFVDARGAPFYFLADTQWELFRRYSLSEAKLILENRKANGFEPAPAAQSKPMPARGPLRVHPSNPRYFTDGSGKAILLTGSHTWGNLQDYQYAALSSPPALDFNAYLDFLQQHHHNFFRLWAWESSFNPNAKQGTIRYDPMPYQRPGPGLALDGQPQFDLIRFIKQYESTQTKQHPVGMTATWPGGDDALLTSPADWISTAAKLPLADGRKVILNDTDHSYFWTGLKADGLAAQRAWVWENFLRGNQCLFMDPYLDASHDPGRNNPAGGLPDPYWDTLRQAMGQTRRYAERMNLAATTPRDQLASTRFCLADPGHEYLVYLPQGGEVTVDLSAALGRLYVEWLQPDAGKITRGEPITGGGMLTLKAPFDGEAVLYVWSQ